MNGKTERELIVLNSNEVVEYNITEKKGYYSTEEYMGKYIAWKDGKLVFEDTPITQIADRLKKMFNIDVEISDVIKDYFYSATFADEPQFQTLDLMTISTMISYKALPP